MKLSKSTCPLSVKTAAATPPPKDQRTLIRSNGGRTGIHYVYSLLCWFVCLHFDNKFDLFLVPSVLFSFVGRKM